MTHNVLILASLIAASFYSCKTEQPKTSDLADATSAGDYSVDCYSDKNDGPSSNWSLSVRWHADGSIRDAGIGTDGGGLSRATCQNNASGIVPPRNNIPGGQIVISCEAESYGTKYFAKLFKITGGAARQYGARIDNGPSGGVNQVVCAPVELEKVAARPTCFTTVPKPAVTPTYNDIKGIVAANCSNGCHTGDSTENGEKLSTLKSLQDQRQDILGMLQHYIMPDDGRKMTFCKSPDGIKLIQWLTYGKDAKRG